MNYNPETHVVVPKEPTKEMIKAGMSAPVVDTGDDLYDQPDDYRVVYKAMIAAAPAYQSDMQPQQSAEPVEFWYFSTLAETETILAVEPSGKKHVVKHGDMNSVDGRNLLTAMSNALAHPPAPPNVAEIQAKAIEKAAEEIWYDMTPIKEDKESGEVKL